jgi:hypothetical protein
MTPAGFEPVTPASDWMQNHALDRAATWIEIKFFFGVKDLDYLHSFDKHGNINKKI